MQGRPGPMLFRRPRTGRFFQFCNQSHLLQSRRDRQAFWKRQGVPMLVYVTWTLLDLGKQGVDFCLVAHSELLLLRCRGYIGTGAPFP